ncbi:MAG: hypothetical protein CMF26_04040 [Kiloniella sp.]|nr:hypothetical protein [Kiloniella sp.]
MRIFSKSLRDPETITLADRRFDVSVNRMKRARRLTLRLDTHGSKVRISAPETVEAELIASFLERNRPWLEQQLASRPDLDVIRDGSMIPLRGQETQIVIDASANQIELDDARDGLRLRLPKRGEPILRLQRFLITEARRDLTARAERISGELGRSFRSLHVRDTKTRWGSCSSRGGLNFSWRLIFAEDRVREYVVAHEVAHLRHMDHSPAFWAQCKALCPPDLDIDWAKQQLRDHGKRWHAMVFDGSVP